jgi:NitT/TauT family transport system substrate-binding protein
LHFSRTQRTNHTNMMTSLTSWLWFLSFLLLVLPITTTRAMMMMMNDTTVVDCLPADTPLIPMSFQLDWKFNAQFAGLFQADAAGYFTKAGVNMTIRPWQDGIDGTEHVAVGLADFACVEQNLIIRAQAELLPIVAVATMFQFSPYGLMAPPETNLTSLEMLRGKTVGVHVDGLKVMDLVKGVTGYDDIDVVEIPYADKWNRTASGELAAVQCYVIDEPIGIRTTYGVTPSVIELSNYGFQSTAQTIVVSDRTLHDYPTLVTAVLGAIFQGWVDVLNDKDAAAKLVVDKYVPEGSVYKDYEYQRESLELLEHYVLVQGREIGSIDPTAWTTAAQLMLQYGIVESLPEDLNATFATAVYQGPFVREACPTTVELCKRRKRD